MDNTEDEDKEATLGDGLKEIPFGEILDTEKMLGRKEFEKRIFGDKLVKKPRNFHRENRNRPTETSSKIVPKKNQSSKTTVSRDPRFESFCGTYNPRKFNKSYSFVNDIRKKEKNALMKELRNPDIDNDEKRRLSSLLQSITNKIKAEEELEKKIQLEIEEKERIIKDLEHGKTPHYKKKSEKKLLELVNRYEELKSKGKLRSHIQKQKKKKSQKIKKKMYFDHRTGP